jgi:hypothetical protein
VEDRVLEEISLAIELEYAILEEQQQELEQNYPLEDLDEVNDTSLGPSFGDDGCSLLCPFCRASAMITQRRGEGDLLFQCPQCQNHMVVSHQSRAANVVWRTNQFCEELARVFSRCDLLSSPSP